MYECDRKPGRSNMVRIWMGAAAHLAGDRTRRPGRRRRLGWVRMRSGHRRARSEAVIQNGHQASPGRDQIWRGRAGRQGSETHVKLMELKDKTTLSREEAAARLHAIADELASDDDVVIERDDMRFVAHVPDQVNLKVEFEIEDDGTELEIELTW